jgi:hypothetical protein
MGIKHINPIVLSEVGIGGKANHTIFKFSPNLKGIDQIDFSVRRSVEFHRSLSFYKNYSSIRKYCHLRRLIEIKIQHCFGKPVFFGSANGFCFTIVQIAWPTRYIPDTLQKMVPEE